MFFHNSLHLFYDPLYLILVLPAVLLALIASASVNSTFEKYQKQLSARRITGAEAARRVLDSHGLYDVGIRMVAGKLSDHYDPRDNTIYLSEAVHNSTSTAAIGVAAHEAGHAVQHAENYLPIKIRAAIIPATNIGSRLAMPLILIGLLIGAWGGNYLLAYVGVICFSLTAIFQLVTLPTEFNASARAMRSLESGGILSRDELRGARKVLTAAAMTYVAALAVSLAQLLRILIIVAGNSRRRD